MQQLPKWAWVSLVICMLGVFVLFRWEMRREPLNSDDMILFQFAAHAATGQHWLFQSNPAPDFNHHALRIGTLPFAMPVIGLFGPTALAYYLVPLVFSLCGFALTWFIMHREIQPGAALAFALVLLLLPFEVIHSSLFLVDTPAAVVTLLCLVLVVTLSRPTGVSSLSTAGCGSLIGLVAFEGYLLRENVPILLAPAFVFFLFSKQTRRVVVWAGAALALGICLEQLLYLAKGFGWGFRVLVNARDQLRYSHLLPVYTWGEFVVREFAFVWHYFKGWPDGVFAVTFYVTALIAHAGMFFWARSPLLRALALTGLATWFSVAFVIYERVDGGVRALLPPNFRYFQFFFYSAIVSLCWGTHHLYYLLSERLSVSSSSRRRSIFLSRAAFVGIGFAVLGLASLSLHLSIKYMPNRLLRPTGGLQETLHAIDELAEAAGDVLLPVHITPYSLRLFSLFRGPWSNPPVVWEPAYPQQLAELTHDQVPEIVLRDTWREVSLLNYRQGQAYERVLSSLRGALWDRYEPVSITPRFALHRASSVSSLLLPNGDFQNAEIAAHRIPFWHFSAIVGKLVRRSAEDHLQLALPPESLPFYLSSGDPPGFSLPPAQTQAYRLPSGRSSTFRIHVAFDAPVTASVFIIQYDAQQRIEHYHTVLHSGENYITVVPHAAAQSYRVALRFSAELSRSWASVELIEVRVRSDPE